MRALTPAPPRQRDRSLRLPCLAFRASRPQPRRAPERRFASHLSVVRPGLSWTQASPLLLQARRNTPPNRVRLPTGCSFASSCSPPHLAAAQLPSAS